MFGRKKLLARIEALENRLTKLENMHAHVALRSGTHRGVFWEVDNRRIGFYGDRQLTAREIQFQPCHPQPKVVDYRSITNIPASTVDTDRISKVTLEELARLVIDGTPIKRQEKISAERISEYTEDTTTTKTTIIE